MTNDKFIKVCKKFAEINDTCLNPNNINISGVEYFYKSFKEYCINNLLNEDDEDSVFKWMYQSPEHITLLAQDFSMKTIGHDPLDNYKIVISGMLRDYIHPQAEIKRGNSEEIIKDISSQLNNLGYKHWYYEGGSHIRFQDEKKEKDLYLIRWFFDENYKQENIVKKVCAELEITQKELAEIMKINDVTVRNWSSKGQIPESSIAFMEYIIENKNLKEENQEIRKALSILKKYS